MVEESTGMSVRDRIRRNATVLLIVAWALVVLMLLLWNGLVRAEPVF